MKPIEYFETAVRIVGLVLILYGLGYLAEFGAVQMGYATLQRTDVTYYLLMGIGSISLGFYFMRGGSHFVRFAYSEEPDGVEVKKSCPLTATLVLQPRQRIILMKHYPNFVLKLFHITLGIVVLIQSLFAVFHSLRMPLEGHLNIILPWFAGLEAIAAILFLIPKTIKIGGWILLAIFAFAVIVHGPLHGAPLFVYAAGVLLVMFYDRRLSEATAIPKDEAS